MEKITATYYFETDYVSSNGSVGKAIVCLVIDYRQKNYSIKPITPHDGGHFVFDKNSKEYRLAVLKSIELAIEFGDIELW